MHTEKSIPLISCYTAARCLPTLHLLCKTTSGLWTHCWSWDCLCHLTGRWVSSQSPPLWTANAKEIHLRDTTTILSHCKCYRNIPLSLIARLTWHSTSLCMFTWTAFQFESRLDGCDSGDDGSIRHDGSVHINFLGGCEWGAKWQSIVGAARLLCFQIQQLEESKNNKWTFQFANRMWRDGNFIRKSALH